MRTPEVLNKLKAIIQNKNSELGDLSLPVDFQKIPISLKNLYPGFKSYALEIGSGWGEFVLNEAQKNPDTFFLAIEKKKKRVLHAIKQQKKLSLKNLRFLILDVTWFFEGLFAKEEFSRIIVNFPDPWPKKRHHKHRFFSPGFLDEISKIAALNATLEFATDYYPYLEEVFWYLEKHPAWQNQNGPGVILTEIPNRFQSYYEILARKQGLPVYFLEFKKGYP